MKIKKKILYFYIIDPTIRYVDFINTNFCPSDYFSLKNGQRVLRVRAAGRPIPKKEMLIGFHSFFSFKESEFFKEKEANLV